MFQKNKWHLLVLTKVCQHENKGCVQGLCHCKPNTTSKFDGDILSALHFEIWVLKHLCKVSLHKPHLYFIQFYLASKDISNCPTYFNNIFSTFFMNLKQKLKILVFGLF